METKDAAVRDELYEEAQLLRRRQQDYKSELVGLPGGPAGSLDGKGQGQFGLVLLTGGCCSC